MRRSPQQFVVQRQEPLRRLTAIARSRRRIGRRRIANAAPRIGCAELLASGRWAAECGIGATADALGCLLPGSVKHFRETVAGRGGRNWQTRMDQDHVGPRRPWRFESSPGTRSPAGLASSSTASPVAFDSAAAPASVLLLLGRQMACDQLFGHRFPPARDAQRTFPKLPRSYVG